MRAAVVAVAGVALLVFTGVAASASSYVDAEGDANTPADITSVAVSEAGGGVVAVSVDVANYRLLPANGSFDVWFDVDGSPGTGNAEGREARVRYRASGAIGLQLWSGTRLIDQPPTGITGSFADARFLLSVPKGTLGLAVTFGVYVVSARGQPAGNGEFVASDAAPDSGNIVFRGAEPARLTDRAGDHHSAPDISSVGVTDAEDGWVTFAVTMPNAGVLPRAPVVGLSIDADDDPATGDAGADLGITTLGTDFIADRWSERSRSWVPVVDEPRVRVSVAGDTVAIGVHRSELGAGAGFGFAALAAGLAPNDAFTGVDLTPDGSRFFRYVLQNRLDVRLVAAKVAMTPARPAAGKRLTVWTTVTRSDTGVSVAAGSVTCRATIDGKRVATFARYSAGRASCAFTVPKKAKRISGSMTVRADGISTTVPFSYRLR
jgi:hypothetical protein